MSKASEYAKVCELADKPVGLRLDAHSLLIAKVTKDGGLETAQKYSAKDALLLADWIYETFGEAENK